jgi:hypothetical protein
MAWYRPIGSPHLCRRVHEWLAGTALRCSGLSARLAGYNNVACPHVLQALTALASVHWKDVSVT